MDEHYFSADPSVRVHAGAGARRGVGARPGADVAAPASSRRAGSTSAPRCCSARPSRRRPGRYLDLGCGYGVIGLALARGGRRGRRTRRRRQRARGAAGQRERRGARRRRPLRRRARPDGVPADETYDEIWSNPPIRIGKEALHDAAAHLAAAARARRPGGDGGRQEPRRRLAAALARRAGLADRRGWPAPRASGCWRPGGDEPRRTARPEQLRGVERPGSACRRRPAVGRWLEQGVDRGGYAVQPAEPHHLAVEVVGLDAAGAAAQALPRGAARRVRVPATGADPQDVAAALAVLGVADHAGCPPRPAPPRPRPSRASAQDRRRPARVRSRPGRRCRGSIISLRCFQAITSARGSETNPARRNAAATRLAGGVGAAGVAADVEDPGDRAQCCSTTPGSRWPVGIITQTPCTSSKNRSSVGSLATPFCSDTTGVVAGSAAVRSSTAAWVWWLLTASSTVASAGPASAARRRPPAAGTSIVRVRRPGWRSGQPVATGRASRCVAAGHQHDVVHRPRGAARPALRRPPRRRTRAIACASSLACVNQG